MGALMSQPLDPNLQGLAAVLVDVLIRGLEREMAETSKEPESDPDDNDQNE